MPAGSVVFLRDPAVKRVRDGRRSRHDRPRGRRQAGEPSARPGGNWEHSSVALCRRRRGSGARESPSPTRRSSLYDPTVPRRCSTSARPRSSILVARRRRLRRGALDRRRPLARARSATSHSELGRATDCTLSISAPIPDRRRGGVARRRAPRSAGTGSGSGRATSEHGPVAASPTNASTSSSRPSASANALCACSPPNGTTSSAARRAPRARRPRSPSPSRRRRRPARPPGSGAPIASGFVPTSGVAAVRVSEPRGRGGREERDEPRVREPAGPVAEVPGREGVALRRP